MSVANLNLSDLELDALTELVNIGVSHAASNLRKMVSEEILLSVPAIQIATHAKAATLIAEREGDSMVAVSQDFAGALQGRALLLFPQDTSLELVRAVVDQVLSQEEAADLEEEALAETGNIILNSCLASMANMLRRSVSLSLPQVMRGPGPFLLDGGEPVDDAGLVLFFYINFAVRDRNIRGYIAMVMDMASLAALKLLVNDFIERVMSDDFSDPTTAKP